MVAPASTGSWNQDEVRDRVRRDLRKFHIDENTWFKGCPERAVWRQKCRDGLRESTK